MGFTKLRPFSGYQRAAKRFFHFATRENQYFPIWGTCLGFEQLTLLSDNMRYSLIDCASEDRAQPLYFKYQVSWFIYNLFGPSIDNCLILFLWQSLDLVREPHWTGNSGQCFKNPGDPSIYGQFPFEMFDSDQLYEVQVGQVLASFSHQCR